MSGDGRVAVAVCPCACPCTGFVAVLVSEASPLPPPAITPSEAAGTGAGAGAGVSAVVGAGAVEGAVAGAVPVTVTVAGTVAGACRLSGETFLGDGGSPLAMGGLQGGGGCGAGAGASNGATPCVCGGGATGADGGSGAGAGFASDMLSELVVVQLRRPRALRLNRVTAAGRLLSVLRPNDGRSTTRKRGMLKSVGASSYVTNIPSRVRVERKRGQYCCCCMANVQSGGVRHFVLLFR